LSAAKSTRKSPPSLLVHPAKRSSKTELTLIPLPSYDTAVVTCASIQAGDAENVVIDDARIAIDVRTTKPETRVKTLASIKRIVAAEALAGNAVKDPTFQTTRAFPLTVNDHALTEKLE